MDLDTLQIRMMQHGRTLSTRIPVLEAEDGDVVHGAILVRMTGDGVELVRLAHSSEGTGEIVTVVAPSMALDAARRQMDEIDRLSRRDRQIRTERHDPSKPPSWSFAVDAAAAFALRTLGIEPLLALNPPDAEWMVGEAGLHLGDRDIRGAVLSATRRGADCRMSLNVGERGSLAAWTYDDRSGTPTVSLTMRTAIAQDALSKAVGRPLGALVAMPGLDHAAVVEGVACRQDGTAHAVEIRLEPRRVPLARAPTGVDTTWLCAG